ncbi:hypothetical protein HID58_075737, partial [Brassica napus]
EIGGGEIGGDISGEIRWSDSLKSAERSLERLVERWERLGLGSEERSLESFVGEDRWRASEIGDMGEMGQIAGGFDGVRGRELGGGKPEMEDFPNTEHSFPSLSVTRAAKDTNLKLLN